MRIHSIRYQYTHTYVVPSSAVRSASSKYTDKYTHRDRTLLKSLPGARMSNGVSKRYVIFNSADSRSPEEHSKRNESYQATTSSKRSLIEFNIIIFNFVRAWIFECALTWSHTVVSSVHPHTRTIGSSPQATQTILLAPTWRRSSVQLQLKLRGV